PQLPAGLGQSVRFNMVALLETAGVPLARLACSQAAATAANQRGDYKVELTQPHQLLPRDFVLRVRLGADQPRVQLFTGENHYMVCLLPPRTSAPNPAGVDTIFVVDRSQAMAGPPLEGVRRALLRCLEQQGERDRIAIWAYNEQLSGPNGGRLATQAERQAMAEWLKTQFTPSGSADLHRPLEQLRSLQSAPGRSMAVVVLSASALRGGGELLRGLQARPLSPPVHCLSLSPDSEPMLRRVAELQRGCFRALASPDQIEPEVARLMVSLRQPVAANMEVVDQGLAPVAGSMSPERLPDLLAHRPVACMGRKTGAGAVGLQLMLPHETAPRSARVGPFPTNNPALAAGWASLRLTALEDRLTVASAAEKPALLREADELCSQTWLFSRAAALVVVDVQNVPHVHVVAEPGETLVAAPTPAPGPPRAEPSPPADGKPFRPRDGLTQKTGIRDQGSKLTASKKLTTEAKARFTKQKPASDRAALEVDQMEKIREKQKERPAVYDQEYQTRRLVTGDKYEKEAGGVDPAFESAWSFNEQVKTVHGGLPSGKLVPVHPVEPEPEPEPDLRQQILDRLQVVEERLERLRRQPSRAHAEPLAEELYYTLGMLEQAVARYPNLDPLFQQGQELYRSLLAANPAVIDGLQKWLDQWKR
ncbi:MAG: hypothetical protein AB1758_21640, partial [Candidatus Eremiobacterota bacterium]